MNIRNALTVLSLAAVLAACGGSGGGDSAPGVEPGPPPPGGQVPPEPPVQPEDSIAAGEISEEDSVETAITGVSFNSPVSVTFSVVVNGSQRVTGLSSSYARFTLAKLVPTGFDDNEDWMSYIDSSEDPVCRSQSDVDDSNNACTTFTTATDPAAIPDSALKVQDAVATGKVARTQATYERNGQFADNGDGTWTYRLATDPGDPATLPEMHRVCIQFSFAAETDNECIDFVPTDLASLGDAATSLHPTFYDDYRSRQVFTEATCNTCHADLALHGARKVGDYCVTCHNPGSADANSGNTVDLKVMVHRIHNARNLDSVQNGTPYKIWGFRNSEHDFSNVSYPQNVINCTRCHAGQEDADWAAMEGLRAPDAILTPDGHNWAVRASRAACTSCHEDAVQHTEEYGKYTCEACHSDNKVKSVREVHRNLIEEVSDTLEAQIVSVTDTAPGEFPKVRFKVVDPTNGDKPYDIKSDSLFTSSRSRLRIDLAWSTTDYTNVGNSSVTALQLDGLQGMAKGDGSYEVTSGLAIPDGSEAPNIAATGSLGVGIEGRGRRDFGEGEQSIPITNAVDFAVIDEDSGSAHPRRDVVDFANCNDCHRQLAFHGGSRSDDQICVMCHNPRLNDFEGRAGLTEPAPDGKISESFDFKVMIHGIHGAAAREIPYQVAEDGEFTVFDEEHIQFPGDLSNCETCHNSGTYSPPIGAAVPVSVAPGDNEDDPSDDLATTPTAAVCSSCHDSAIAKAHMVSNGALFEAPMSDAKAAVESCEVCHGNDAIAGVNLVHPGLR